MLGVCTRFQIGNRIKGKRTQQRQPWVLSLEGSGSRHRYANTSVCRALPLCPCLSFYGDSDSGVWRDRKLQALNNCQFHARPSHSGYQSVVVHLCPAQRAAGWTGADTSPVFYASTKPHGLRQCFTRKMKLEKKKERKKSAYYIQPISIGQLLCAWWCCRSWGYISLKKSKLSVL